MSFVHVASVEAADGRNPLGQVEAFARFQEGIADRCDEPPVATEMQLRSAPTGSVSVVGRPSGDRELLEAARRGDEGAYGKLVEPHRDELHAHCYRMLGSVSDAEDALQEALLRAWRGLPGFEGRSSLRSWLYRIATNTCLRAIERRPKRVLPVDFGPAAEPRRASRRAARRVGLDRAVPRRAAGRRAGAPLRRPATSSARPSSWRSSRRFSSCRRASGRR